MNRITLKDVARVARVTPATVSMVINGKSNFKDETIKKVFSAINSLNYTPNITAKRLSTRRTETIAFMVNDIKSGFEIEVMRGIEKQTIEAGYDLLFVSTRARNISFSELVKNIIFSGKADGIICGHMEMTDELTGLLKRTRFPFVMLENKDPSVDMVKVNNRYGGYLAGRYLHSIGKKVMGVISAPLTNSAMSDRVAGFRRAATEFGGSFDNSDIFFVNFSSNYYVGSGKQIAEKILYESGKKYEGFFVAAGDEFAIGAMQVFLEKGMKIPEEICIIGYDDIPISKLIFPALTTIRQDLRMMGEKAFGIFEKRLRNNNQNRHRDFEPIVENVRTELIVRDTT